MLQAIAIVVFAIVCSIMGNCQLVHENHNPQPLTIEAIFAPGGLAGRPPETVKWSPNSRFVSFVQRDGAGNNGELWLVDSASGEKRLAITNEQFTAGAATSQKAQSERQKEWRQRYSVADYEWAPDSQHLLFNSQDDLWLWTEKDGSLQVLGPHAATDPKFSPNGRSVSYIHNHDLYVCLLPSRHIARLTQDGAENLLNGEVDWLYAEELATRSNYFWSPDSSQIAFLQMNEKDVPTYPIVDLLDASSKIELEKYPAAGEPNPQVRIGVVSVPMGKTRWISLSSLKQGYVPRFGWLSANVLWIQALNRSQDELDVYFVDLRSGNSRIVHQETVEAWGEVNEDIKPIKGGDTFVWASWRDGYTHLYLYSFDKTSPLSDIRLVRQLTAGDAELFSIDGMDEAIGVVYFTGNRDDPRQRQLYAVNIDGSGFRRMTTGEGTHNVEVSPDGKAFIDWYSTATTPHRLSVCSIENGCRSLWQPRNLEQYGFTPPSFMQFKTDDGTILHGELFLPPDAARHGKNIPLVIYVYGGPATQVVRDVWNGAQFLLHQKLLQRGIGVFAVDNRGTPGRGRAFMAATRHQFGRIELHDQMAALNQLLALHPEIDRSRIALWGWSSGGSMVLYALTHSDIFRAGIAIAPVVDWRDYDSLYSERYIGTLPDYKQAYEDAAMQNSANNLHGRLLLVHGTSDDNVHYKNTMKMVDALISAKKQFELLLYPGKTHSISGQATRVHLYTAIERFLSENLLDGASQVDRGQNH
jgi:dipeptidyl-peptidase 4